MRLFASLLVFFLFGVQSLKSQFITAGQYQPGQYYVDLQPDTTINAPWAIYPTKANFLLDMNGDSVVDFDLHVYKSSGLGSNFRHCYIEPKNNNEVAVAYTDSCFGTNSGCEDGLVWVYGMVRAFEYGELINDSAQWADSLVYLSYNHHSDDCFYCGDHTFGLTDTSYIGVRFFTGTDTVYGWIKVSGVSDVTCTIQALTGESGTTGSKEEHNTNTSVKVFPNPVAGLLRFDFGEALPPNAVLMICDNMGRQVIQQDLATNTRTFNCDVASLVRGVYFYVIRVPGKETITGRIVMAD